MAPSAPRTPTCAPNTSRSNAGTATRKRSSRSPTRSWIAAYYILRDDVDCTSLGGDYFARRADPQRQTRRLVAQLERLGHTVTLHEPAAA
jgi:hypothetical protein